jgi:anti-sigma factor RsiW
MTGQVDPAHSDRISAYLDGVLTDPERVALEALIAADPAAAAEFEALSRVDAALAAGFQDMLDRPLPLNLARAIDPAAPVGAVRGRGEAHGTRWGGALQAIAASLVLLGVGAAGGAMLMRNFMPETAAAAPGWLDDVAEYHAVYSAQGRHLVEVPAAELAHLESWLSGTTGVDFKAPDLSAMGLSLEGGRLLVANGEPVAQLMYRDAAGAVVALCFMAGGDAAAAGGLTPLADRRIGGFDLVSWKSRNASYVVIGPADRPDLRQIAGMASAEL